MVAMVTTKVETSISECQTNQTLQNQLAARTLSSTAVCMERRQQTQQIYSRFDFEFEKHSPAYARITQANYNTARIERRATSTASVSSS